MQRNVPHSMARTATGLLMVTALGLASLAHAQTPAQTPAQAPATRPSRSHKPCRKPPRRSIPPSPPIRLRKPANRKTTTSRKANASARFAASSTAISTACCSSVSARRCHPTKRSGCRCVCAIRRCRRSSTTSSPTQPRSTKIRSNTRPLKSPFWVPCTCTTVAIDDAGAASRGGANAPTTRAPARAAASPAAKR